ncbi:unnamed protein product [Brachionus calyciflorus]|uniref:Uncharacterized protein n=1 Tax=Brachionus calyciflorus TaxID=104777 RepID=A0A813VQR3_9BILA|nr:unnamed protein product [Brachionus calyciflorus]
MDGKIWFTVMESFLKEYDESEWLRILISYIDNNLLRNFDNLESLLGDKENVLFPTSCDSSDCEKLIQDKFVEGLRFTPSYEVQNQLRSFPKPNRNDSVQKPPQQTQPKTETQPQNTQTIIHRMTNDNKDQKKNLQVEINSNGPIEKNCQNTLVKINGDFYINEIDPKSNNQILHKVVNTVVKNSKDLEPSSKQVHLNKNQVNYFLENSNFIKKESEPNHTINVNESGYRLRVSQNTKNSRFFRLLKK